MKKFIYLTLISLVGFLCLFFLTPLPETESNPQWIFYDRNGQILYTEKPFFQTQSTIPDTVKNGIVIVEDQHFFDHHGVDFSALFRAGTQNLKAQETVSGASTITMQLARLLFLEGKKRNYWYKVRQIAYALKLETKWSKDEILNQYLEKINFGTGANGITAAANRYFHKTPDTLALGELATLTGTIQNPSLFNPLTQTENAKQRKQLILNIWYERDLITEKELNFWNNQMITIKPSIRGEIHAPHFVFWIKSQLEKELANHKNKEIHVHTTIDRGLHQKTLHILQSEIKAHEKTNNAHNASAVAIDLGKNEILSMVGSVDFFDESIDGFVNITTAKRSTGSILKPFLYALAIKNGFSPLDEVIDEKTSFAAGEGRYAPNNFKVNEEYGRIRFREALTNSYNLSAVNLLQTIGLKNFMDFLNMIGLDIGTAEDVGLAAILGAGEENLLNLTTAYTIFPREGIYKKPNFILKVLGEKENELTPTPYPLSSTPLFKKALPPHAANWATHALSDTQSRWKNFQQGNVLEVDRPAAVKTGTSQEFKDNWVIGYSPDIVLGIWVGNAGGEPLHTSSGVDGAGPMWNKVFRLLHQNLPEKSFQYMSDRQEIDICRRPYEQNNCTEKMTEFLLPQEIPKIKKTEKAPFSIAFPNDGDIFHRDTELLLKARNIPDHEDLQFHLDDNKVSNHIPHLSSGKHTIWAESDGELTGKVEIVVGD